MASTAPVRLVFDLDPVPECWYLDDDESMPHSIDQDYSVDLLRRVWMWDVARRGADATVVSQVALRWDEKNPGVGVDPDLCLVEPAIPRGAKSILTWKKGHSPPRVAVEVVSEENPQKDYVENPAKYAASKTSELWVFDPLGLGRDVAGRTHPLQVWRRTSKGGFRRVYAGPGPAFSREFGAWIVVTDEGRHLRVANDAQGRDLWPTAEEERDAEKQARADAEAKAEAEKRARADAEAKAEAEKRARTDAEAKARALEAELAKLRGEAPVQSVKSSRKRPR
jgi:Uma2 family endonuclease